MNRNKTLKKSIISIFFFKGLNILIGFLLIPLTVHYIKTELYGVWLTLSSITTWISTFDIGLGNGLRNKLSEAISLGKKRDAREYISTAYIVLTIISLCFFFFFNIISCFLDWQKILKISINEDLFFVILILILGICLRFIVQNISIIFFSLQKPQLSELVILLGNIFSLIIIYIFKSYFVPKLLYLVFAISLPPVFVMLIVSIVFFLKNKDLSISIKYFNKRKIKSLLTLGISFFILQVSSLVSYSLTNFIILQLLDSNEVTKYNVAYKYFSIISFISTILCAPLWSAFTDAFVKNDFTWIRNIINKMIKVWVGIAFLSFFMLIISDWFYFQWMKMNLNIPFSLSLVLNLFMLVVAWNGIFIAFVNGVGKIRLQVYLSIIPVFFTIPLSYFFVKIMGWGITGVASIMLLFNLIISVITTFQVFLIINKKDKGIWSK